MNLHDFSHKRNLEELLHSRDDDSGYIEGKVFMIWPPRNRLHRINLEVAQDSALYRFEVEVPHKQGITFRPHERISLALKGMRVDQRKESNAPHCFPIVLRFPEGVVFKYLSGANTGKVVNTWEGDTDEWYNPGVVHTVSGAVTIDASGAHHGSIPTKTCSPVSSSSRMDSTGCHDEGIRVDRFPPLLAAVSGDTVTAQSLCLAQQLRTERHTRSSKPRRKKRKLHKEKESASSKQLANDTNEPCPTDVATPCHEQPQPSTHGFLTDVSDNHPKLLQVDRDTNVKASIQGDSASDLSRGNSDSIAMAIQGQVNVRALQLKAGVRTERGDVFTALGDLQKSHSMVDIIAVVTHAHPEKKTRTNEWSRSFALVDPSTVDSLRQGIAVNCFQKKYLEWLPQVQKDDVVILRKLKVVEFNGVVTATGYSDKLRWAVYDPLEHSIRPPNKGSAPEKELVDDGMGYEFSPYWEPFPDSAVLDYCRQIGEWWKAKYELDGQNMATVQCQEARKRHLLISEASPDLPPRGFFNCTVEVLQKFSNHGDATTIYVTDYTASALVRPVHATWCPPELCDRVLQCDMWDNAKHIAKMMNPGEYWYLHNVRAKWNPSHCMEGTMQLADKVTQLDATKLEAQPHLKSLLLRKSEFGPTKSNPAGAAAPHIFPEMLLQDIEGNTSFFTCIVELLHDDLDSRDGHYIYVTDYTYNPDLPTIVSTADWARDLQHRVLKIKLDDVQAGISLNPRPSSILIIHNLRIKRANASGSMHGCLGGENPLIHFLDDLLSHHAKTLQGNKEKWKREIVLDGMTTSADGSYGETHGPLRQSSPLVDNITIAEVLSRPAPDAFRVSARAIDFFPFSLDDACVLRCTKCESSPPSSFKHCPRCDDMLETHCRWFYCLYILLQDEQGSELIVSLSGEECRLLQDVDPADFRYDQVAFRRFLTKLDPILGNLRDVHVAWSKNEPKVIQSPLMAFTIESWNVGDERGYGLLDCICRERTRL